jgi:RimJ/RimL family protein N-acetyltransferase
MTEADWPLLLRWNSDPEVLYYSEGDDVKGYALADVQAIYRGISLHAFCFIVEAIDRYLPRPIGECWLQEMNLDRILERHPDADCRRIDLMIGEKELWGQGYGTEMIRLLTTFGFQQGADRLYGCDVADYNPRSFRAFWRLGYRVENKLPQPPGHKARFVYDLVLTRERRIEEETL